MLSPDPMFASLLGLHKSFAWFVILSNGLAGLWALGAHYLDVLKTKLLWWFVGLAQLSVFVQVTIGVSIVAGQDIKAPEFHMLYGFVSMAAVMVVYGYRQQLEGHRYLLYAGGELFVMGLGIRAMVLG